VDQKPIRAFFGLVAVLTWPLFPGLEAADVTVGTDLVHARALCQPIGVSASNLHDYRGRSSAPFEEWSYRDNWAAHTGPATERIRAGEITHRVMADLDFTLRRWPNHTEALKGLVDYALAGGRSYEFPTVQCYFANAHRIFPDDVAVHLLEGYFYSKSRQYKLAEQTYLEALSIDSDSSDIHYNLGLLYFELSDFESALKHAQTAYSAGFPLPGLRKKLEQAGRWSEPKGQPPQQH
jgi:tetratricopeptide (TPR) repeat protein